MYVCDPGELCLLWGWYTLAFTLRCCEKLVSFHEIYG
jgi:hypothetical protein